MTKKEIASGVVHTVPQDLKKALLASQKALDKWNSLTPLARNEWICWVTFPKKEETRSHHIKRLTNEIAQGKRRPCCWIGCIHRKDKAISPSIKGILSKRSKRQNKKFQNFH